MAKDKEGHGSEKRAEHGPYSEGNEFQANAWGQGPNTAKHVRKEIREQKKTERMQRMFKKRGYGLP